MKRRIRLALLVLIALLYAISIPWYRPGDAPLRLIFGLPDWVAVALGCYVAAAILNAAAWLLTELPESEDDLDEPLGVRTRPENGQEKGASS